MWFVDENRAMSGLPKCGSQSLREHFRSAQVPNTEVINIPDRIVWLKNTQIRLISNYSFFKVLNENDQHTGIPNSEHTESWESWIDFILETDDPHWAPQIPQLTHDGEYLGTVTHRFEDINKLWSKYYRGMIPHINGYTHEPVYEYRRDEINEKYQVDIEKWHGL